MIAVTCFNGERFPIDPGHIERVETDPDTVIHLVDRTRYVVTETFDDLLRSIRDHRATLLVAQQQIYGGVALLAEHRARLRVERRSHSRDGGSREDVRPDRDGD